MDHTTATQYATATPQAVPMDSAATPSDSLPPERWFLVVFTLDSGAIWEAAVHAENELMARTTLGYMHRSSTCRIIGVVDLASIK